MRRYVVPVAKGVGADLIEMAPPETGNVMTGKEKLKSVAAIVGKKFLRKQLGAAKTRRKRRIIRTSPPKIRRHLRTREDISANLK